MIQNSIFTFKRIDEQNGYLHQDKSTFVVIDYYQGFKPPFLRLVQREFKRKSRGRFGWTTLVRSSKWRPRHSPEADFDKIYDKSANKTKKSCYRHTICTTKRTQSQQIAKQPVNKICICPFFVLHQWHLHASPFPSKRFPIDE